MSEFLKHIHSQDDFLSEIRQRSIDYIHELKTYFGKDTDFFDNIERNISSNYTFSKLINKIELIEDLCDTSMNKLEVKQEILDFLTRSNYDLKEFSYEQFHEIIESDYDIESIACSLLGEVVYQETTEVLIILMKIAFCRYVTKHNQDILLQHHAELISVRKDINDLKNRVDDLEGKNSTSDKLKRYYKYYKEDIYEKVPEEKKITGQYSLKQTYYPAYNTDGDKIIDCIDQWVQKKHSGVMLLYGEPGHGKTSFCYDMVYRFIQNEYFRQVNNVFYFNLNPKSWYDSKRSTNKLVDVFQLKDKEISFTLQECENSIVLLDGYDELKGELGEDYHIKGLISELKRKADANHIFFIITSRKTAIIDDLSDLEKEEYLKLYEFAHLTVDHQDKWVIQFDKDGGTKYQDEWNKLKDSEIYKSFFYKKEDEDDWFRDDQDKPSLLGIPILFRIVILNPLTDEQDIKNRADLYKKLLEVTLERDDNRKKRKPQLIAQYEKLAYRIFANKERKDTITSLRDEDNELLFSYYLRGNKHEIGFIHRSFYQYFLACYLYKRIKSVSLTQKSFDPYDYLVTLQHRILDQDELNFLIENYNNDQDKGNIKERYEIILDELVKTKGQVYDRDIFNSIKSSIDDIKTMEVNSVIKELYQFSSEFNQKNSVDNLPTLNQANNTYYNCINIMSKLGLRIMLGLDRYKSLLELMRYFYITGLDLSYQEFTRVDFSRMNLNHVDFSNTTCFFCKFNDSNLRSVNFKEADLTGSRMRNCEFNYAKFEKTVIDFVDFRGSNFNKEKEEGNVIYKNYKKEEYELYNEGISIGTYKEEEIIGRALDLTKEKELVVITEQIIESLPYNEELETTNWSECTLRKALNGEGRKKGIVDQIDYQPGIKERIKSVTIENKDNKEYGTDGGPETTDRMYLLSIKEAEEYFIDDIDREATGIESIRDDKGGKLWVTSGGTSIWWLRSPGAAGMYAAIVHYDGSVNSNGYIVDYTYNGVRPAFRLEFKSEI